MANKTLINGTAYDVANGATKIDGTGYTISGGRTLINGTGYDVNLKPKFKWDEASWADLNDLCIQKQNGEISDFPDGVVINNTKTLMVGGDTYTAQLVGLDELPGSMTFFILDYPYTFPYTATSATNYTVKYSNSAIRAGAQACYNNMEAQVKNIIRPVVKRSGILLSTKWASYEDTTEYVFVPDVNEFKALHNNYSGEVYWDEVGTVIDGTVYDSFYDRRYLGNLTAGSWDSPTVYWWSRDRVCELENNRPVYDELALTLALYRGPTSATSSNKYIDYRLGYPLTTQYRIIPAFIIGRQGV